MATPQTTINKTLDYYLNLPYPIMLVPDAEDGTWYAAIPLLDGCVTDGDSPEEALKHLKEAQASWIEASLKFGDPIPEPEAADAYLLRLSGGKS